MRDAAALLNAVKRRPTTGSGVRSMRMLTNAGFYQTQKALETLSNGGRLITPIAEQALVNLCYARHAYTFSGNNDPHKYGEHYHKRLAKESAKGFWHGLGPMSRK